MAVIGYQLVFYEWITVERFTLISALHWYEIPSAWPPSCSCSNRPAGW